MAHLNTSRNCAAIPNVPLGACRCIFGELNAVKTVACGIPSKRLETKHFLPIAHTPQLVETSKIFHLDKSRKSRKSGISENNALLIPSNPQWERMNLDVRMLMKSSSIHLSIIYPSSIQYFDHWYEAKSTNGRHLATSSGAGPVTISPLISLHRPARTARLESKDKHRGSGRPGGHRPVGKPSPNGG